MVLPGKKNPLLNVVELSKKFGGIQALTTVSFNLAEGSITSVIGPNGAGKTTLINVVSGIYRPMSGEIHFDGQNITGQAANTFAAQGISRTFQFVEPFESLSVLKNVMVGCHSNSHAGLFASGFRLPSARAEEKRIEEESMAILKMVGLESKADESISSLPLGERKLMGVARALSKKPKLLMLDEPVGGLATHEIKKVVDLIYKLAKDGLAILIVEHNMQFVMSISDRVIAMDRGCKIAEGLPNEVKSNEQVIKAYLGEEA